MATARRAREPTVAAISVVVVCRCQLHVMGRLKGISAILSPDLLHALSSMGHGDEIGIKLTLIPRYYAKNSQLCTPEMDRSVGSGRVAPGNQLIGLFSTWRSIRKMSTCALFDRAQIYSWSNVHFPFPD